MNIELSRLMQNFEETRQVSIKIEFFSNCSGKVTALYDVYAQFPRGYMLFMFYDYTDLKKKLVTWNRDNEERIIDAD